MRIHGWTHWHMQTHAHKQANTHRTVYTHYGINAECVFERGRGKGKGKGRERREAGAFAILSVSAKLHLHFPRLLSPPFLAIFPSLRSFAWVSTFFHCWWKLQPLFTSPRKPVHQRTKMYDNVDFSERGKTYFGHKHPVQLWEHTVNPGYFVRTKFSNVGASDLSSAWHFRTAADLNANEAVASHSYTWNFRTKAAAYEIYENKKHTKCSGLTVLDETLHKSKLFQSCVPKVMTTKLKTHLQRSLKCCISRLEILRRRHKKIYN